MTDPVSADNAPREQAWRDMWAERAEDRVEAVARAIWTAYDTIGLAWDEAKDTRYAERTREAARAALAAADAAVGAVDRDALARAVMGVLQCHVQPVCDGSCNTGVGPCNGEHEERECYEHEDPERVPFTGDVCWLAQSVVDAIRPLLAGGVPGRSEAEIKAEGAREVLLEAADDLDREAAEAAARGELADVRCLDCNLRYDERQDYGCGEPGYGHKYDDDELAEAAKVVVRPTYDGDQLRARAARVAGTTDTEGGDHA